jgi:hypothetical protein
MAALYVRVTTDAQPVENQIRELRRRLASFSMESRPGRPFRPLAPEMPASLVDLDHIPATPRGNLPKLPDLIFHRLCVSAYSHVQRGALR